MRLRRVLGSFVLVSAVYLLSAPGAAAQTLTLTEQPQAASTMAAAQRGGGGVGFGVELGLVRPRLRSDDPDIDDAEGENGWLAGIWFGGNRNGVVGVMGEITYGVKKFETDDGIFEQRVLEIPVLARINIGSSNRNTGVVGYGLVGPVVDINLASELDGIDIRDEFESFDLGIMAGGGIEVSRFGVEIRGNWGMRNIVNPTEDFGDEIRTFSVQIVGKLRIN